MRIWSLHPAVLDRAALVSGWREGLLAQKVLGGGTKGYTRHPQLTRFRAADDPVAAIVGYLQGLADEADARGYRFDRTRITSVEPARLAPFRERPLPVTTGQLAYEAAHLRAKVSKRDPGWLPRLDAALSGPGGTPPAHPLFTPVPGDVEPWEVRG